MVTIKQVAARAGVSPTTASYALNNRPEVREETRKRVFKAAKELNYVPNRLAQSFRNGKTNTITVVTNEAIESANTFTGEFFGVLAEARHNHYDVLVKLLDNNEASFVQTQSLFRNRTSDGFIFLGNLPDTYLRAFTECDAYGVLLSAHTEIPMVQVNCDGRKGIYDITEKAIRYGRKKPVYLAYGDVTIEEHLRKLGFIQAMQKSGLDSADAEFVCGTDLNDIKECVEKCIKRGVDCFICWNDILAYTVMDLLKQRKILIPQQIAVTGFDDIPPTAREHILTTVHQPFFEKGKLAFQLLLDQINNKECEKMDRYIECKIVERKSL